MLRDPMLARQHLVQQALEQRLAETATHLRRFQHLFEPLDLAADLGHAPRGLLQRAEAALHVADDLGRGVETFPDAALPRLDELHSLLELACHLRGERGDLAP